MRSSVDHLAVHRALPSSLLLLSRAFTVTQPLESPREDAPYESLKETISSLPNAVCPPPTSSSMPLILCGCIVDFFLLHILTPIHASVIGRHLFGGHLKSTGVS